jgi:hypothetical protein
MVWAPRGRRNVGKVRSIDSRPMILSSLLTDKASFERGTGWALKPQGACKGDVCVPLRGQDIERPDVSAMAGLLQMGLASDEVHGLWALGPASGKALISAEAPDLSLPEFGGGVFELRSLRGMKVFLLAWASW